MVKEMDVNGNGKINYSEFIAATINVKKYMTDERLLEVFKHFDVDDTNYISKENIQEAMRKLGRELKDEEID